MQLTTQSKAPGADTCNRNNECGKEETAVEVIPGKAADEPVLDGPGHARGKERAQVHHATIIHKFTLECTVTISCFKQPAG